MLVDHIIGVPEFKTFAVPFILSQPKRYIQFAYILDDVHFIIADFQRINEFTVMDGELGNNADFLVETGVGIRGNIGVLAVY